MATAVVKSPDLREILGPVLPSLPPAALSTAPPETVLPFLSPILRQRVQLLSSSSTEPWIRLLCYDTAKAARLSEIARTDRLEPHPVSGDVEVDWDYDASIRYRRLDEETLQALVALKEMELSFQLVYCTGDSIADNGWKVGEVTVTETPAPFSTFGGVSSIAEADRQFQESRLKKDSGTTLPSGFSDRNEVSRDEEDDDDYWARYDATPARTPAAQRSPAPVSTRDHRTTNEEDDYYAQYDSVQPAMDNHDPDEDAGLPDIVPPLGLGSRPRNTAQDGLGEEELELNETHGAWTLAEPPRSPSVNSRDGDQSNLVHPRPASSASSNASIAKLEAAAENFGVQQHISRSVKSLFLLARASGIDREEFEGIVKRELDLLGLMED